MGRLADEKRRHAGLQQQQAERWFEVTGVRSVGISVLRVDVPRRGTSRVRTTIWETQAATASTRLHGWSVTPDGEIVRPSGPAGELVDEMKRDGEGP